VHGKQPGLYDPDSSLTRAEFTKIALNTFCISTDDVTDLNAFPDVQPSDWHVRYIAKAKEKGIIIGYNDGYFRPDRPINRSEAIKIILETAELNVPDVSGGQWYTKYVNYALQQGITTSADESNKAPDGTISRAEMAKVTVKTKGIQTEVAMSDL